MDIDKIVDVLNNKQIAIIPTDTVYGIIGDATSEEVIRKVYDVKNRDYSKALIIMVSSREMLHQYVKDINEVEEDLINKYWPGRLTILFKKNENISDLITSNSPLVGVRWPDNQELIEIIERFGKPIISTSANVSNQETITGIDKLESSIIDKFDYIYDGGEVTNLSSTIVKIDGGKVVILRYGDLAEEIEKKYQS